MSTADEIKARYADQIRDAERRAAEEMDRAPREPVVRPPNPEPTMDDPDIPEWVRKYGPRRSTGQQPDG